jgi:rhomboid protease GluP
MSPHPSDHQPELHPPVGEAIPIPEYAPAQRSRRIARSDWNPRVAPATYLLVAINVGVFLWMLTHGVSAKEPTTDQLVQYGATNADLILGGQWWRLVTAIFVHVGLIHIGTNMWCLWNLGMLGEPLLGPVGLFATYLITGIAGNLLSLAVNVWLGDHGSVGAGASGAVFGIAGILIVLLSNYRLPIPVVELKRLRKSVIQFAILNLIIGGATILPVFGSIVRIDNSAHIGGFLSGLALGPALVPSMTAGRVRYFARQKVVFVSATFILALVGYWISKVGIAPAGNP